MRLALSLLLLSGCWCHDLTVPVEHVVVVKEPKPVPCLATPMPPTPNVQCDPAMSPQDCEDISNAAWSDYGHRIATLVNLYIVPRCMAK